MNEACQKLAEILRLSPAKLSLLNEKMAQKTGRFNVLANIYEENKKIIEEKLKTLNLDPHLSSEIIFSSLLNKVTQDDFLLNQYLNQPDVSQLSDCQKIGQLALQMSEIQEGYFLKLEKAKELLIKEPPKKIISALGYQDINSLLSQEDLLEIFCGLRFLEDNEWLNNVFFKQYENLSFDDFEKRPVIVKPLSFKWRQAAEKFVAKKYHNISHLKELGVIFIIPLKLQTSGELLRMLSLIIHYCYEIIFYNEIFQIFSQFKTEFSRYFIEALKGKVLDTEPENNSHFYWLIIQRYLAKEDVNDPRLFKPHLNPEVFHWQKTGKALARLDKIIPAAHFTFWSNLDWVGDYFLNQKGQSELVSFNLVDLVMSLVKNQEKVKYLYHHQEALWNKIFESYFSEEAAYQLVKDNWLKGFLEI